MTTAADRTEQEVRVIHDLKTAIHALRDGGWTESEVRRLTEQTLNEERHEEQ